MPQLRNALKARYALVAMICFSLATDGTSLCWGQSRFVPLDFEGAVAISDDGLVVAGEARDIPYIWTEAAGLETIPLQNGQELFTVSDISGDGTTVVGGVAIRGGVLRPPLRII